MPPEHLKRPVADQRHEPLAFLSSSFKGAEVGWSTFEKEGFAIFQTFEKMDYLFQSGASTHVFTDHRNLLFVFALLALEPSLGRHVVSKVQRWALFLSRFQFVIEHIEGEQNVCPDMLTRWARGYRRDRSVRRAICSMLMETAEHVVPSPDDFVWPSMELFRESQSRASSTPEGVELDVADRLWKHDSCIWIPEDDKELQLKVLVVSHCGTVGHRGGAATHSIVAEEFWWSGMKADVSTFVRGCLHCLMTRGGDVVPRPLGTALHGTKTNEVVHMDFLYMGPGRDGNKYVLILRDDLSSFVWLWSAPACTAEVAADALSTWCGSFGSMTWLVSDQGSHFKNELVEHLTAEMKTKHHFTTAYSPWANGSVERVCREVLRSCKALTSEWKLGPQDWPAVTECVQSLLNHAPLQRLGARDIKTPQVYRTPLEVFTGHLPVRPLLRALPVRSYMNAVCSDEVRARQLVEIASTQSALEDMHREVAGLTSASRKRRTDSHNKRTNIQHVNFTVGDFVLVRCVLKGGHKLRCRWRGPRRIVRVKSEWVYEVEDLVKNSVSIIHARRLKLYKASMDGKEVDSAIIEAARTVGAHYETAERIRDIRLHQQGLEVLVEWQGLPDEEDHTWEPLKQIFEDLPGLLEDFLHTSGKRDLKRQAQLELGL